MGDMFNKISEKYINQLGQKQILKTVKLSIAESTVKQAVDEAASVAQQSIKEAVAPLKAKIAQKDEFITKCTTENQEHQNRAKYFEGIATSAQDKLDKYKNIVKEAYKIGLTPEIREQKTGIAHILSSLLKHKQPKEIKPEKTQIKKVLTSIAKPKIAESKTQQITPQVQKHPQIQAKEPVQTKQQVAQLQQKTELQKPITKRTYQSQPTQVSPKVLAKIENERAKQVLDKDRMTLASQLIRKLIASTPSYDFKGISEQYQKATRMDFSELLKNTGVKPICNDVFESIKFKDKNDKELLSIKFDKMDKLYNIRISDKNGLPMVTTKVEGAVTKEMRVYFNEVNKISAPEVWYDKSINNYAQKIITEAKKDTVTKVKDMFDGSKYINYYTPDGVEVVKEYYGKDSSIPNLTWISNPRTGNLEKFFGAKGSTLEKYEKRGQPPQTYKIEGFDKFIKYENDKTTLEMFYIVADENKRYGVQTLYDKNSGDKNNRYQKILYEKTNYGLAAHPITKAFSYFDLSKHNIDPWNFSILKPYIK